MDSIQCLNFAEKWFNSIVNAILLTQKSIQTIIQFKLNSGDSIQKIIQGIYWYWFNQKSAKKCPKSVQQDKKNYQKLKIQIQYTIHSSISWYTSIQEIIQHQFFRNIQFKRLFNNIFSRKFNSEIDSKIWFWLYSI